MSKKNSFSEKIGILIFVLIGGIFYLFFIHFFITSGFSIWGIDPSIMNLNTKSGLTGLAYTFINNLMVSLFGSFAYKISAIVLIVAGVTIFVGALPIGYYLLRETFKKKWKKLI